MKTLVPLAALLLSLHPVQACAQTNDAAAPAVSELPRGPQAPLHGLVPNAGATPGVTLVVESLVTRCSRDAVRAADGLMTPGDAVVTCTEAITGPEASGLDLASTLVNRGVLLMTMSNLGEAKADFDQALAIQPELAEALVNRGMILLAQGKPREALVDLDRGINLQPAHPERAYYRRGQAREDLKDIKGAYADYKAADALKPGWEPVGVELSRFKVKTPTAQ
jgi:tetratricopeptide (TPR) repeat protein